jgi:hypothetical protein
MGALALDQAVDLTQVARQVVLQRHDAAEAAGFALRTELPPTLVLPHSHPLLLERLLANLVDNALQYGGSRGGACRHAGAALLAGGAGRRPRHPGGPARRCCRPSTAATPAGPAPAPAWGWPSCARPRCAWARG